MISISGLKAFTGLGVKKRKGVRRCVAKPWLWPQDYIRVLSHAARGAMANHALHERLRQLQCFLARNRLVLDQETHAALAKLGLCC